MEDIRVISCIENLRKNMLRYSIMILTVLFLLIGVMHHAYYRSTMQMTIPSTIELQWSVDSTWTAGWDQ